MTARTNQQTLDAVELVLKHKVPLVEAARRAGVHRSTLYRALLREGQRKDGKKSQS
jgi:transposase-like protein